MIADERSMAADAVAESTGEMRRLAAEALAAFGLGGARLTLLTHTVNATFRVDGDSGERYVLRLYRPDLYPVVSARAEIEWLTALRADGIAVPEPVPAQGGAPVVLVSADGGTERCCALFRWLDGRFLESGGVDAATARRLGELAARLHGHGERFVRDRRFDRPCYDLDTLLGTGETLAEGGAEGFLSRRDRDTLRRAVGVLRAELAHLTPEPGTFGPIHGDLTPKNCLESDGRVAAIDFADCGWGFYLYELATTLLRLSDLPDGQILAVAFLQGYAGLRPLSPESLERLEAFKAVRVVYLLRFLLRRLDVPAVREQARDAFPLMVVQLRTLLGDRLSPRAGEAGDPAALTTTQFLALLHRYDIEVWADGERLRFSAAPGALTPELKQELARRKAEVLELLRRVARPAAAGVPPIVARGLAEAPLSFGQERLWFFDQYEPQSPVYNISQAVRLSGALRPEILERSLAGVVRRHDALRTRFAAGEHPRQIVEPEVAVRIPLTDLSGLPAEGRERLAEEMIRQEARRPFDLSRAPLLRAVLLREGEAEHLFLLTVHHIVSDGWSSALFVRELMLLYEAFSRGEGSPLPPLPIQYTDYAVWQREWLQGEVLEREIAYWRESLAGAPQLLELPTDRPRPSVQTYDGGKETRHLPAEVSGRLAALGQREGATAFMVLLAAFGALLHRYTEREDFLVGSPIAGRTHTETEPLIGFFVNTLALRLRPAGRQSFRNLVGEVRQTVLAAFAHQDLPFEKLVEELQPERALSHAPLLQVVFALQNAAGGGPEERSAVRARNLPMESGRVAFDLLFTLREDPEGLYLSLRYRRDLWNDSSMARFASHYQRLLEGVAADPDLPLSDLSLLDEAEAHQIRTEWNDTRSAFPRDLPVHRLFEQQAARLPEAPALVAEGRVWTYGEVDMASSRLARHLRSLGAAPGERIGLALERSPEVVVALLAILKTGGAYVPLDPQYPDERLAFLLEDAGTSRVLIHAATRERMRLLADGLGRDLRRVDLDAEREEIERQSGEALPEAVPAEAPAYVIYTSGSTGRPKGSVVPHRAVARLVRETGYADFSADQVFLLLAPVSFDASTFEIWGSLLNGARLVVPPPGNLTLEELGEAVRRNGVTVLWLTAGLFHLMVDERPAGFAGLRQLLAGGEALSVAHVRRLLESGAVPLLVNGYGPTENTTFTCCHSLREAADLGSSVPIGRPIANTRVHVLDRHLRPVPIGVAGELCTGGDGLALGYLSRSELTAERFVPDPFSGEPGGRLYRTGDLVRHLPYGTIEFLGRFDDQVKIRGFRIELGEIEAALRKAPGVRDCAVVVREDTPGDRRLVAYVVQEGGEPADLRELLRRSLPDYMLPSDIVALAELPLTPNGKLDRKALPAPGREERPQGRGPRGPVEEIVAGIWAEVLGRGGIGAEESFFEAGGHSLLATQVMSRLRNAFGVELPLQKLFEQPTVAGLAAAVEAARESERGGQAPPLVPVSRETALPLSFAQQRLWFLDRFEPGSPAYNIPGAVRLTGQLRPAVLSAAFRALLERHEALRTTFSEQEGRPVQVVSQAPPAELPLIDLAALPAAVREGEALRLVSLDARQPFDLAAGPVIRFTLLRLAEEEHVALVNMHHIVSDGWSAGIFLRELAAFVEAFGRGERPVLPELPVQYADFAVWQRWWLQGEVLEKQLSFWRGHLSGAPAALELPTDRPRPPVQTFRGAVAAVALSPALADGLVRLGHREGATLYMTLLAAFQLLLARWSGQGDVVVGSPIAGRNRREIEGLIGFFVNTLVLRADLTHDRPFRDLLGSVRRTALEAYAHQDVPFERLVEELAPERDLSRPPLFQVLFVLQNAPSGSLRIPGLTFTPLRGDRTTAKLDLLFSLQEEGGGITGSLEYNTDLFDAPTVLRLLGRFERLLEEIAEDPARRLSSLPWLGAAERHQVQVEWNDTGSSGSSSSCLHELVAAQAARSPQATALIDGVERLSYAELERRSNRLARHLRALGAGVEDRVGICVGRGLDLVVGLLGILKAGAVYVPLDPAYPAERLAFMIEDAGSRILLTQEALLPRLPEGSWTAVLLDGHREEIGRHGDTPLKPVAAPENLGYLIYTSGSTGRPKGVAIEHRSAATLVRWAREVFGPEDLAGVMASTSISFDLSVFELFVPLSWGGTVILAANALALPELPAKQEIRLINTVPSALAELLRQGAVPSTVRTVNLAGEPLTGALAEKIHGATEVRRLFNLYGPSEDTTYSTFARIDAGEAHPSIGRPLAGTRAYVLDRGLSPVGIGGVGELYLAGEGLARGYLGRPEITAAGFVPDPFGAPGQRLYRTGDLVRLRPDGELRFLGRIDHQVKVRGFRIELGEIEAALRRIEGIAEVAVVVREDAPGDRRIVAYLVGAEAAPAPTASSVRETLRSGLPEHMIPSSFVVLPELPLTPNGKLDRKALPAPGQEERSPGRGPRGPVEEILAGIWAEVLGRGGIGAEESFFEAGGHSLLATQVMSRLRSAFGVEMPLQKLFERPTVAGLAAAVEAARESEQGRQAPPLVPVPREAALSLSFAQQRLWFLDRFEPGSPAYNIPGAVRLTGRLRPAVLSAAFRALLERHEALRTTFSEQEGRPVQVVSQAPPAELPLIDLEALPAAVRESEALRLASLDARQPFDLIAGPVIRFALLRLAEEEHAALVNMHHIVSDGWSLGIFLRELAAFVEAFGRGEEPVLPKLPVQYADFAVWQRQWLQGEVLEEQLSFWRGHLSGAPAALELPTDRPRPPVQTFRGAVAAVALPSVLADGLVRLGRREGATLYMTLLAAFQLLLARWSGQGDVVVGSPIAGRNRREIEGLIGFFVNTLVLRADLTHDRPFRDLLGSVRRTALEAYTHQDVPFERLVEELAPERDLSRPPLFQVLFALQNAPAGSLRIPGLTFTPLRGDRTTAKLDLLLSLQEEGGGITGSLEYNTDLFDATTVLRLLGRFERLLEEIAEDPARRLSSLPWLGAAERHQVQVEWNDTGSSGSSSGCLHELVAAQAARSPQATALIDGVERLSYAELERRSNRLARHLRALGVGLEDRVGICAERGLDLVVGLLGILKAGAVYVPLDPAYPAERLAFMIEDAGSRVLLTQEALLPRLPEGSWTAVLLDGHREEIGRHGDTSVEPVAAPENLGYLIYTSGSTGRPKGVAIEHRSAAALVRWAREVFGPEDLAGVMASTSISFDLSVFELFVPLSWGGTVILAANALALPELPAKQEIRLINTVPSALAELLRQGAVPSTVRTVNLAGEPLTGALAEKIHGATEVRRLFNLYGPSEDTTYSTFARIDAGEAQPTIGRPLAGTRAYVLDRGLSPVGIGGVGELYLAGEGLARGYLGRPEITAAGFVPDPFGAPGQRLYRTGDLVRLRPDGELRFLGRIDHQVKVRGFRIELGEIEAALRRIEGLAEVVVVVREDAPGDRRIVAYLVGGEAAPAPAVSRLRETLRSALPEHMIPSSIVVLPELPLTPNGKLDRKALPAPPSGGGGAPAASADPIAEVLAGIWTEILGVEPAGPEAHFFELGGHSLLATQVVSRVRETLGVELPLQQLFAAPRLSELAARVREEHRRERGLEVPPITPVPRDGELPLSFAQQRLWFLDRFEPESPAYNMPVALRLAGDFDPALFERAVQWVVGRHETLRTTFAESAGRPFQRIAPALRVPVPVTDLAPLPSAERLEAARELAAREARQPFDLEAGPLLRLLLLRFESGDHLLLLTVHHIVSDGWSMSLLVRELTAAYTALSRGEEPALPPLPVQYGDFAVWQRRWLEGGVLEAEMAYWRRHLSGLPSSLELPLDRPRPALQTFRGAALSFSLPPASAGGLARLGRSCGATLFMTLLAAFQSLLARYTGQTDIVVGSPIAGRTRQETEPLIGCFVNTLVLRCGLAGDPDFREIVARVRRAALEAYACQDVPFERLVEELAPDRDLSRPPLFQVLFVLQHQQQAASLGDIAVSPWKVESRTAKLDLTLSLFEEGGRVGGSLEYNTDLFDAVTIERLAGHLRTLCEALSIQGESLRLSDLPLVSAAERQMTSIEWNDTQVFVSAGDACLHRMVEAQASRTPGAIALIAGEKLWTYAELDARANRLAHRLRGLGVGPEVPVALCAGRSADLIAAILGILKAGGAYVPLDPAYPRDRLAFMLEDTCAPVLVTESGLLDLVPANEARVVRLDVEEEAFPQGPEGPPDSGAAPENLGYFIYTSGSTGRPKGVAIEHRSAAVLVRWAHQVFTAEECAGVLAATSVCFDLSIYEIFVPLSRGGCVILAENALALPELPAAASVTLVNTVPSAMTELVRLGQLPPGVRTVNLAGEPLPARLTEDLYRTGTVERVFNLYGPSEDTTYSTGVLVPRDLRGAPSIGRPIADTFVHLLDHDLRPVPIGVRGELFLAGRGLARFYFRRPELTAEKFVPNPFGPPGSRLYRTGDVARYRHDGELEYLGRTDHQVKIRGFRIELGEVETAVRRHPGVREAVVIAQKGEAGSRLVAYYAPEQPEAVPVEALRRSLEEKLPAYMVPSVLLCLDRLPLTPNGKVDRKALPDPEAQQRAAAGLFAAPRNAVELTLQGIWEEVLSVRPVGITDNFFHLGGHSLAGIYLMACIRERLGRQLPVAVLFQAPTIEGLAALLQQDLPQTEHPFLIPLQPRGTKRPFFCVHGAGGNVFRFAQLATCLGRLDGERPFYGLQARGLMNDGAPLRTIEEMAALYLEAVRKAQPAGPYLIGGYSMGGLIAYEMSHRLLGMGEEVASLVMLDALADPGEQLRTFDQTGLLVFFARELLIPIEPSDLEGLEPDGQLAFVLERGWAEGKIPRELSFEDAARYLEVMKTTIGATRLFRAELPYDGRIAVFKGDDSIPFAADMGWCEIAREVESRIVPGGHRTMFESPHVEVLGDLLKERFDRDDPA